MISLAVNSENLIPKFAPATLMCLLVLGLAHADVIVVCPSGCNYTSITEAIDAAEPGDVIEVHSGTYYENVNVTKQLTLLGVDTGGGKPVVDAGQRGDAITLSAEGITVDGFVVTNSYMSYENVWSGIKVNSDNNIITNNTAITNENGIWVSNSDNNTIAENNLTDNFYGVRLDTSDNNTITNNSVIYTEYGIKLVASTKNNLNANTVSGSNHSIQLLDSDTNKITGNNASLNGFGINLTASTNNTLRNNSIFENEYNFVADGENDIDTSNLADNRPIYYLVNISGEVVNSSSNASTIYCIDCDNITIMDLKLEKNIYGIRLQNATDSRIENNSLGNNFYAIEINNSNNIIVLNNAVENNRHEGIDLKSTNFSAVVNNSIINNNVGIKLEFSEEIETSGNNISNNDKDIYNESSSIINNSIGIKLKFSKNIEISGNNISNYDKGIYNESSSYIEENNIWINNNNDQYTPDLVYVPGFEKFPGDIGVSSELDSGRDDGDVGASSKPGSDKGGDEDRTTSKNGGSSRHPYSNPEMTISEEPTQIEPEEVRLQRVIDRAIGLLPKGQILFHPKERMEVGETELVEVIITRETSEEMAAELAEKEMDGEGEVEIKEVPISYEMGAELTGGNAFEIVPRTDDKKIVPPPPGYATWKWDVKPLERGTHALELRVIATIRAESEEKSFEYPVFERDIVVEVSPGAEIMGFVSNNWQWIITTVTIPVGGWYLSRRVKKKNLPPKDEGEVK